MARIKYVLNERRLAYEGAVSIVSEKQSEAEAETEETKLQKERALALLKLRQTAFHRRRIAKSRIGPTAVTRTPDKKD
jgi:large subunit ribosomal protein L47